MTFMRWVFGAAWRRREFWFDVLVAVLTPPLLVWAALTEHPPFGVSFYTLLLFLVGAWLGLFRVFRERRKDAPDASDRV
jgi:hypothetical protein